MTDNGVNVGNDAGTGNTVAVRENAAHAEFVEDSEVAAMPGLAT